MSGVSNRQKKREEKEYLDQQLKSWDSVMKMTTEYHDLQDVHSKLVEENARLKKENEELRREILEVKEATKTIQERAVKQCDIMSPGPLQY